MKRIRIFFTLLLFVPGVVGCDGENDDPLIGKWEITWQMQGDILYGEVEFFHDKAIIKAFGHSGSSFLTTYQEMHYSWKYQSDSLILTPKGQPLAMKYTLETQQNNLMKFKYLNEIAITLTRL